MLTPTPESSPASSADIPERCLAFAGLIAVSPLMVLLWAAVKLTSRGPAFYIQERVGLFGKTFPMVKFRSMVVEAERDSGPQWAQKSDPRTTPIGKFLRASHLDELPQLINVIRGEMRLVGPRPERPWFVDIFTKKIACYPKRHSVKPGITGLAQIVNGYDRDLSTVRRKLALDLLYARRRSLALDLRLLIATPIAPLRPKLRPARPKLAAVIAAQKDEPSTPQALLSSPAEPTSRDTTPRSPHVTVGSI